MTGKLDKDAHFNKYIAGPFLSGMEISLLLHSLVIKLSINTFKIGLHNSACDLLYQLIHYFPTDIYFLSDQNQGASSYTTL